MVLITAEQFGNLTTSPLRQDLVRGEVWSASPASLRHGRVAMRVGNLIMDHAEDHELGEAYAAETGFVLGRHPDTVLAPDVAFVRAERIPAGGFPDEGFGPIAPDLAVEIVSPGDRAAQVAKKVRLYLEAGVRLVWVLYPRKRQVVVHQPRTTPRTLSDGDTLEGGEVLPGFRCPVRALWT